jgi:peptide/nickel transport system ATP-binding protein
MTEPALLEVRDLTVVYRRRHAHLVAVDGVSFDVRAGQTVGLVGESGSGKSTVANALMGLAPVHAGSVTFAGREISGLSPRERRGVYRELQLVFQDPYSSLNPSRTIGRTLEEPLESFEGLKRGRAGSRVEAMLERVRLPRSAAHRYPKEFSGGQRQRVAIARALMSAPRLVICDEAVSALDLSIQAQILNLLRDLQRDSRLSYLFVSHDLEVVRYMCDWVVVLYRGRVMEQGSASAVTSAPAHPYSEALLDAAPLPDPKAQAARRAARASAKAADRDLLQAAVSLNACGFAARCRFATDVCREQRPDLRPTADGGSVACHHYPAWRAALPHEQGQSRPTAISSGALARPAAPSVNGADHVMVRRPNTRPAT